MSSILTDPVAMLLSIKHISVYQYDAPVPYALQRLRLTPQNCTGQIVHDWAVTYKGAHPEVTYLDAFGNVTELIRHERNAHMIILTATGTVTTTDTGGILGHDRNQTPLALFSRSTALTEPGLNIREFAASVARTRDDIEQLHALMNALRGCMVFETGRTDVETQAETAFNAGHGVCQDFAQIFISAARLRGYPARYVSGYLRMEGVEEQTASHAWAEVHVAGMGWVGFDAANGVSPNHNYVRIANGLDYRDAAPISGIRLGSAAETLEVRLKVEQ